MRGKASLLLVVPMAFLLLLLLSRCGGGGGGGDPAGPPVQAGGTPSISNLHVSPGSFALSTGGTATLMATFDFADDGADVATLTVTLFGPSGNRITSETQAIQGASGLKRGSAGVAGQVDTSPLGDYSVQIFVTDAAGLTSNVLTASWRVVEMPWTNRTALPAARTGLAAVAVSDLIYAIGGTSANLSSEVATVERYTPGTDTWSTMAPMPTQRSGLGAAVVDGKIYAIGGFKFSMGDLGIVEEYTPLTDTWASKAPMPTSRQSFGIGAINGKIFAVGGIYLLPGTTNAIVLQTLEQYDPALNSWIAKSPMPTPRYAVASAVVDGKMYVIGGYSDFSTGTNTRTNVVEQYDPATDSWITLAPMPTARASAVAAVVNGMIYVMGGIDAGGSWQDSAALDRYDPGTNSWVTKIPMRTGRSALAASAAGGKIYAIGGTTVFMPTNKVEEYDTPKDP